MSESQAKNIRRMVQRELAKKTKWLINTFVEDIQSYPFKNRLVFAWKIIRGKAKRKSNK